MATTMTDDRDDTNTSKDTNRDDGEQFVLADDEWRERLSSAQYRVLRQAGTEPPFTGEYYAHDGAGVYRCAGCGEALFFSGDKYDSGSGWPSFVAPAGQGRVAERSDASHGMVRTEVLCARCHGHLGHLFSDGPRPAGLRYCINSLALRFESDDPELDNPDESNDPDDPPAGPK